MKRRDFLKKGIYSSFVVASASAMFISCSSDDENVKPNPSDTSDEDEPDGEQIDINASEFENLKTAGEFAYHKGFIIINTGNGFIALSKICTHQGCTVEYKNGDNSIACPCHGSVFNTNGNVETGPAETALTVYSVSRDGDILTIK